MKYDPMWMLWHWITRNSLCVALNSFWSSFVKRMYLFFKCVHTDFLTPVTNLFASSYVRMVLSTRHILQNSLRYLLLQICVVFIFVLVSCFLQIQKRFFHLAASVWDRRNLRCNSLFIVKYFCCYEYINKCNLKQ